ncbi:primosomal protein N' [Kiritimatiellaeota bacterium B1221]|nr:primosomal protein N' [Kiritimatiellaeota bacterium B1221]
MSNLPPHKASSSPIARVVVDVALDKEFDYLIPEKLRGQVMPGMQVKVPFGRRQTEGFVLGFKEKSEFTGLKAISGLAHEDALLSPKIMELAKWMADYYVAPIEHAVKTVLPGAVRKRGAAFKKQLFATPGEKSAIESELSVLRRSAPKQAAALDILLSGEQMLMSDLVRAAKVTHGTLRSLEKKGFIHIAEGVQGRDPLANQEFLRTKDLKLNSEQAKCLVKITGGIDRGKLKVVLLHGVTGSGKTEVYLQALSHALALGKGAIVLVPEIALTPQTVERFRGRFGECLAVLHSHLSDGERHDEWHRVKKGEATVVVGARSALFAPVKNLGLIVVDEEHESTYKQEESPRYHARDMAVMRGHLEGCTVVLGSATPSVESLENVHQGKYELAKLGIRADDRQLPLVKVVDMRHQRYEGKPTLFSNDLVEGIRLRINLGEQVMLFLNRRGYSKNLTCPECGFVPECPDCSVALTYHKRLGYLRCHFCGHAERVPDRCPQPDCKAEDWQYMGSGTEKIENQLTRIFPHAHIRRMDSDTMTSKHAYQHVLGAFRKGEIDILIGTQMIAKGLHFPNVTLVGVVNADATLHMPDFRAGERAFQLFTQVAGRAGRGDVAGEVLIQTYTPTHPAVQAARRGDFDVFIDEELEARKMLNYPPYSRLICVHFKGESEQQVDFVSGQVFNELDRLLGENEEVNLAPPVPSPIARIQKNYRYQMIARVPRTKMFTVPLRHVLAGLKLPRQVQIIVDVDAISLM